MQQGVLGIMSVALAGADGAGTGLGCWLGFPSHGPPSCRLNCELSSLSCSVQPPETPNKPHRQHSFLDFIHLDSLHSLFVTHSRYENHHTCGRWLCQLGFRWCAQNETGEDTSGKTAREQIVAHPDR